MKNEFRLTDADFMLYRNLIYDTCGINLTGNKKQLLVSRLEKRLRYYDLRSFRAYFDFIREKSNHHEMKMMIDLMTTNKTEFFRESAHFDYLIRNVYPRLLKQRVIRIWSAGCSSGEEPYTIAITLLEKINNVLGQDIKILATDISEKILNAAETGIYRKEKMALMPGIFHRKYFLKGVNDSKDSYRVKDEVRNLIRFKHLNLMQPFPFHGKFDIIFCRNVMIYFDKKTQAELVHKIEQVLVPGGHFLIGHSENLTGIDTKLKYVQPTVYWKE